MFHQRVSEICFEETVRTGASGLATAALRPLATPAVQPHRLAHHLGTGDLPALAESLCILELTPHVDPSKEAVVAHRTEVEHSRPVAPGSLLRVGGWVEQIGERSARFRVRIRDETAVVCELRITLQVVDAERSVPGSVVRPAVCPAAQAGAKAALAEPERERHADDPGWDRLVMALSVQSIFPRRRAASSAK